MQTARLKQVSSTALHRELTRRHRSLQARRAKIARQIEQLDSEIEALAGTDPIGGRKSAGSAKSRQARTRATNQTSLVTALRRVLRGRTLSVSEAAEQVQRAGYRTHSANFRTIVNMTLVKHRGLFKRVGHGQYTAK